jgi:diaminopropionate ammonia-lyase
MKLWCNPRSREGHQPPPDTDFAGTETVRAVRRFHRSMPGYAPTPLVPLPELARAAGLGSIWIKDESHRFGLKAFKTLGASFAVCTVLAERLRIPAPLDFNDVKQCAAGGAPPGGRLFAASDGNHGAAVAWMAAQLGCRSRIYLPHGTSIHRQEAIRAFGAETVVIGGNYDDAVRQAAREADEDGGILIQDTAWEGYTFIPRRVMQGYLTLFDEAFEQLADEFPTHIFVPCGVGALAASLQAYLVERFGDARPVLVVVEAAAADCYYRSMAAGGRGVVPVQGHMHTTMAGLACGEPTRPGWEILRRYADGFASCEDAVAIAGMRQFAFPVKTDPPVESGECGAVTLGCLCGLLDPKSPAVWRQRLDLGPEAKVLLFSTEGATDPASYQRALHG